MKALSVVALVLSMVGVSALSAQQSQTPISSLDRELWMVVLEAIRREKAQPLALLNETLPTGEIRQTLRGPYGESTTLVENALRRNEMSARILPPVANVDLVEIASVRKPAGFDLDAIQARGQRVVRLSLPVVSDDGTRALVFSWTARGFNDLSGAGYVFEKRQGVWTIVNYIAAWIT